MMIMDYDENIGAHVSDEYDDMKQMSREGHCGGHMYLTKLYVGSALVYGRSSELGLSNLHLRTSVLKFSSNWILTHLYLLPRKPASGRQRVGGLVGGWVGGCTI